MLTLFALALMQAAPVVAQPADPVPLPGPRTLGILDAARFDRCHDLATDDAVAGIAEAQAWLADGGGHVARQCLGFAQSKAGQYAGATESFAQAAQEAEAAGDWRASNLWAQAGNAALAAGDAVRAKTLIDAALAGGRLTGVQLGLAHLDRAQAEASQDPLAWLLSATLARRQGDLARAQADITVAAQLGPRDAAIALEAGNIAAAADNLDAAEASWTSAAALGGNSPQGEAARARLEELRAVRASETPPG